MAVNSQGTIPLLIHTIFPCLTSVRQKTGRVGGEWWYKGNNNTLNFKGVSRYQITKLRKYDATNRVFWRVDMLQLLAVFVFSLKLPNSPIFVPCCITYWQRTASFDHYHCIPCGRGIIFQKSVTDVSNNFTHVRTVVSTSVTWMTMFPVLK
jgi:hypothetical protein